MRVVNSNRERVVGDIIIAKKKLKDIQRELCIRPGSTPEETLRSALLQKTGYATASTLQKQLGNNSKSNFPNQNTNNPLRVKQEPTLSVQKKKLQNGINRAKIQSSTFGKSNKPTNNQKACYFCGKEFSPKYNLSCPARDAICKSSNKNGHFARCCNSAKNVNNVDNESDSIVEKGINFITSDSESEFGVLKISAIKS